MAPMMGGRKLLSNSTTTVKIGAPYRGWGMRDLAAQKQYSCGAGGTSLPLSAIADARRTAPSRDIN
jgi:hypothetical protein